MNNNGGEKGQFGCYATRGSIVHDENKHGRAGWQGNKISFGEANRGLLDCEVNKHGWAGEQGNEISSKETTSGTLHEVIKNTV